MILEKQIICQFINSYANEESMTIQFITPNSVCFDHLEKLKYLSFINFSSVNSNATLFQKAPNSKEIAPQSIYSAYSSI